MSNVSIFAPIWSYWFCELCKSKKVTYKRNVIKLNEDDPRIIAILKEIGKNEKRNNLNSRNDSSWEREIF